MLFTGKNLFLPPLFWLVLLLWNPLSAQQIPDALLWKVSGKNLSQPSYLYGTLHAICLEDLKLKENALRALNQTNRLVLELDVTEEEFPAKMQQAMLMKGQTRLQDLLPRGDYQLMARYFQDSIGISLADYAQMQPIFLATFLYNELLDCTTQSYEMQLSRMARLNKKEVEGLETFEEQMRVFGNISYREQAEMLLQSIVEYPELEAAYWNMIVSYKNEDLNSLYHIIRDIQLGMQDYEEVMINGRNQRWIPRMEQMAREEPSFFAVGAAHLPGNKGLIALLKRRGYEVEPVF
ncbi:TraB/GumN family protein [Nafulsella turpanensis]|uniref:TraB/GumN family protein n=1 Tax=Nafulsella turpanensis TaxID=1265690 RepID=UPI0003472E12|nr:TraB/GumN family protein [Nafulsella turpanensis]